MFYKSINNKIIISGAGTYDFKETIKSLGGLWNEINKTWEGNINLELLKEKCSHIKEIF